MDKEAKSALLQPFVPAACAWPVSGVLPGSPLALAAGAPFPEPVFRSGFQGSSPRNKSSMVSRWRMTRAMPPLTSTSAARGRLL